MAVTPPPSSVLRELGDAEEDELRAGLFVSEAAEPPLLAPHRSAPCLAVPSLPLPLPLQQLQGRHEPPDELRPLPSSAAAAASVLVDGPCAGPYGWTSMASQDGQLRILATAAFLHGSTEMTERAPQGPLMLAHVLRLVGPAGPGPLLGHAWATRAPPSPPSAAHYLGTLHRDAAVVHATADPARPPAPWATVRPCAEARCLDLLAFPSVASESPSPEPAADALLVAVGGSFGLEVHTVSGPSAGSSPGAGPVGPQRRLLPRASVSLLRFSPCGRWLAVACLDGRVGVLDVEAEWLRAASSSTSCSSSPSPSSWHCTVVRGERATGLAFAYGGRRLAVACADGNVLMLRWRRDGSGNGWEPCPVFLASLRAMRAAAAATATTAVGLGGNSGIPCWPALVWSPDNRYLAVSLPGNGLCPPEMVVLDAATGARLGSLSMARSAQGMSPCPRPAASFLHCIDEAGELQAFRWTGPAVSVDGDDRPSRATLLARSPTAAVWALGGGNGTLRLRWCRRRRRQEQKERPQQPGAAPEWESADVAVPFLPAGTLAPLAAALPSPRERRKGTDALGHVFVGESHLGLLLSHVLYVCDWPGQGREEKQPEWQPLEGWGPRDARGGGVAVLAAAVVGGARVVAVLEQEGGVLLQSRRLVPEAEAEADGVEAGEPLAVTQEEPARWTVLSCPPSSSSSSSGGEPAAASVVVVAVSRSENGGIRLWRVAVEGDGALNLTDDAQGTPLQVEVPPVLPGSVLLPVELRATSAGQELRFWEVENGKGKGKGESGGGVRRCWALGLYPVQDAGEEDYEIEGEGLVPVPAWRLMRVRDASIATCPGPPPSPCVGTTSQ